MERKYGHSEACGYFRAAIIELKGHGADVLTYFQRPFPAVDPENQADIDDQLAAELAGVLKRDDDVVPELDDAIYRGAASATVSRRRTRPRC